MRYVCIVLMLLCLNGCAEFNRGLSNALYWERPPKTRCTKHTYREYDPYGNVTSVVTKENCTGTMVYRGY